MTSIAERLEQSRLGGATVADLATMASEFFADSSLVAIETRSAEISLSAAASAWAAMDEEASRAWQRYPSIQSTGVHGGEPDPRAAQLFSTLTYLRGAGFYTPQELTQRAAESPESTVWAAREAIRLHAALVALGALVSALDDGSVEPAGYAEAVSSLARRFAGIRIASG